MSRFSGSFGLPIFLDSGYDITGFQRRSYAGGRASAFERSLAFAFSVQDSLSARKAGETGGTLEGRPRHSKIALIASGVLMAAKILIRAPQRSHLRTSISHTRFISSAQV